MSLWKGDRRFQLLRHEENRGAAAARNIGFMSARGEYVTFLDDDDEFLPIALEELVRALEMSGPEVGFSYGWYDCIGEPETQYNRSPTGMNGDISQDVIAFRLPCGTLPALFRSSALRDIGGWNESLLRSDDTDLIIRVCQVYHVVCVPKVIANVYRKHGQPRLSDNTLIATVREFQFRKSHIDRFSSRLRGNDESMYRTLIPLVYMPWWRADRMLALSLFFKIAQLSSVRYVIFKHIPLFIKVTIWHATPLSRFRDRARSVRDRLFRRASSN